MLLYCFVCLTVIAWMFFRVNFPEWFAGADKPKRKR